MAHAKPKDNIPLYSAENELRDWISPQRAERLEGVGIARVVRHKKVFMNRCVLLRRPCDPRPIMPSAYVGKPYSFRERLDSGRFVWALRKLNDAELDSVLLQVVRDCSSQPIARNRAQLAHVGTSR